MKHGYEETSEDSKKPMIPQENIHKPSVNPFRSDALKSIGVVIIVSVGIGLICRFTDVEKTPYFRAISFVLEGNCAMKLVRDLRYYFGYREYRKNTDHNVSKDFYLKEMQRIEEMRAADISKKRK